MIATPAIPKGAERLHRVTSGALANVLGQLLNVAVQLGQVPILLAYWGNQAYGEWLAVSAVVAYLSTLDLGVQTYTVNRLTHHFAAGDIREYTRVLHSGLLINLLLPLLGFCLVLPLILVAPIERWLHFIETDHITAAWITALLSLQAIYSVTYGMLLGIYRTIGEYARGQMVSNLRLLFNLLLTVIVILVGGRLLAVAVLHLLIYFATTVVIWADLSRLKPEIQIGFSQTDWRLAFRSIGPGSAFLGIQIVNAISVQGSLLIVNTIFGPAVLVVFTSLRTLSNLIKQAGATVQHALWPEFTALDAQARYNVLRNVHLVGAKSVMAMAICSTVFLLIGGERVVQLWTHGRVPYDQSLMAALLALACSQAHWFSSWILLIACDRQALALRYVTVASILGLVVGYIVALHYGVVGFVWAVCVVDVVICGIGLPLQACQFVRESRRRFLSEVTARSALTLGITYLGVTVSASLLVPKDSAANGVVLSGLLAGGIGMTAAYLLLLNSIERDRVHAIFVQLLSRFEVGCSLIRIRRTRIFDTSV